MAGGLLAGKVAIVTGASRGIGRGIADRFVAEGARLIVTARGAGALERAAAELEAGGAEVLAVPADGGVKTDVERVLGQTLERFGTLDVVVNNGAWASPVAHILEMDEAHWDAVIQSNLKSLYLYCHGAANIMVDRGVRGSIVNISSFAAERSHRYMAAYDATKGGLEAFTRAIAIDLAPFGIRVNTVGPGAIHTEEHEADGPEARIRRGQTVPLGRVGEPADVAAAVAFLASDDADYITGQKIYVDGGVLAQLRSPQVYAPLPPTVAARLRRQAGGR